MQPQPVVGGAVAKLLSHLEMRQFLLFFVCFLLTSCFPQDATESEIVGEGHFKLTLHISGFNQIPFSRTSGSTTTRTSGSESITRLDLAIFDEAGTRLAKVNQEQTDADFLQPSIRVPEGNLHLVIIGHSGAGVATLTSPSEVSFPKNKVTDTFSAYRALTISEDTPSSLDIELSRVVSMVRVILTDAQLPADFTQLQLYYTGGSSTLNPQTGFGAKNSRQTEVRTLAESTTTAEGYHVFEIYTFPHIVDDELKLTLTPQNAQGLAIAPECVIEAVPVKLNCITECQGLLFSSGSDTDSSIHITLNDQWGETLHHDF